jgi:hypothetical protein
MSINTGNQSMRVDERSLTDQVSSTASRTAEPQRIQVDTGQGSGVSSTAGPDHVDLSTLSGRISQTLQSAATQSAARVSGLQKAFRASSYQPDVQQLSRALAGG